MKIDSSLEFISQSFDEAKEFLITKMVQNNKWRKKYRGGKITKMNRLYKSLKVEYQKQQNASAVNKEGGESESEYEDID